MVTGSVRIIFFIVAHGAQNYLHRSSGETESVRLCRRKAMECQRTAMTTTNPVIQSDSFIWRSFGGKWPTKGSKERLFHLIPNRPE